MWKALFAKLCGKPVQEGSKPAGLTEVEWPRHSQPERPRQPEQPDEPDEPEWPEYPRRSQLRPDQPDQPDQTQQRKVDLTKPHIVRFGDGSYSVRKQVQGDGYQDEWSDYFYNPMSLTLWSPVKSVYSRKTLDECKEILIKLASEEEAKRQQEAREAIVEVLDWSPTTVNVAVLSDGSTVRLRS